MKYCAQCGASNADDAAFCEKCGSAWGAVPAPVELVAPAGPKKRGKGLLIALLVGVLVIAVALGGYWMLFLKPMSASDYEREVSKSAKAAVEAMGVWQTEVGSVDVSWDDNPVGDENLDLLRTPTGKASARVTRAFEDLEALRPPKKYEDTHAQLLDGVDSLNVAVGSLSTMFGKMTGDDSLNSGGEMVPAAPNFSKNLEDGMADIEEALTDMGLYEEIFPEETAPE